MAQPDDRKEVRLASRFAGRVVVENVNHPGKTREVDAKRYHVVREALLAILPEARPGMGDTARP